MNKILSIYRLANILSLDVAAGAVVCASFFSRLFNVVVFPQGLASLGLTVWIIYTMDHLLDARKLKHDASTERHRFHQQHAKTLLSIMIVAMAIDVVLIYFLRTMVFISGLWMTLLVGIYFLVQQRIGFLKELIGAILYTGGVLLIPFSIKDKLSSELILLIVQFGMIAWINLLLFSYIDQARDENDRHQSFATIFGQAVTRRVLILLFIVIAVLSLIQLILFSFGIAVSLTMMWLLLLLIFVRKDFFEMEDRYRLLGDAVFLLPTLCFLF